MPASTKVKLYIGTNVGDLNQKSELPSNHKNTNARILVKTAEKVIKEAQHNYSIGDEEKSYILYMRYFNVVTLVKKSPEYKKQKDYYENLIGKKNILEAITRAEDLAKSLKDRYDLREAEEVADKLERLKAGEEKGKSQNKKEENGLDDMVDKESSKDSKANTSTLATDLKVPPATPPSITCMQLYSLLQDKEVTFIIMDLRSSLDFEESKINHQRCISVPAEYITAGTTVSYIEKSLPQASKSLWKQRGEVEKIILVDWSSRLDNVVIGTPMRTLKDALFKYDSTIIMKNEPVVLDGGYEQWLLFYPMLTTNANVTRATATPDVETPSLNFDYPDFDTAFLMTPSPGSQNNGNSDKAIQNVSSSTGAQINGELMAVKGNLPKIDRSTKPAEKQTFNKSQADNTSLQTSVASDNKSSVYPSIADLLTKKTKPEHTDSVDSKNVSVANEKSIEEIHEVHKQKEEELGKFQKEKERMEFEQRARMEKLKEEERRLEDIARMRKLEEKSLADLMRQKKQIQDSLRLEGAKQDEENRRRLEEETNRKEELRRIQQEEDKKKQLLLDVEKMRADRKKKEERLKQEKDDEERTKKELEEKAIREAADRAKKEAELKSLELKQAEQRAERLRKEEQDKALEQRERLEREKQIRIDAEKKRNEDEKKKALEQKLAQEAAEKERLEREQKIKEEKQRAEEARLKKEKDEQIIADNARKEAEEKVKRLDAAGQRNQPKTVKSPVIPSGWEKMLDRNTNRFFYVNHDQGTTQWESPYVPTPVQSESSIYTAKLKEEPEEPKRSLSRSHSFSNLSKLDDDQMPTTPKIPAVDRTKKPAARPEISQSKIIPVQKSRVRDFNPVFGSVGRGLTGLRNLGNTCYMNSTIQCLNNTSPMVSHFLTDKYMYDLNRDNISGDHGEVTEEFAAVIKALWSGQYRFISPRDLKTSIGRHMPMFEGYTQQDSQEFLTFLLDGLHEGLNKVQERPKIPELKTENLPDHVAADASWKNHIKLNNSVIVDLFQGQLKSTLLCLTCRKKSVKFEAFMFLSVPIPSTGRCSLQDCIKAFLKEENLTGSSRWKCPQCKRERDAVKKIDLWKLPKILLIGLNRFMTVGVWREKDTRYVDFPLSDLNINQHVLGTQRGYNYNLYGVSNHFGTMEGGHYTAFCKNPQSRKWYKFDDHESYEISSSDVKSNAAFVLYYTSFNFEPPNFSSLFS